MTELIGKATPNTQVFRADYNSFDFDPKTGHLTLKFGRLPSMAVVQSKADVPLDAVVHVDAPLSVNFIVYMVRLAKTLGMDLEAISKVPAAPAIGPDGRKNN